MVNEPKPHLVAIGGPSCSGKTTLAQRLASRMNAPLIQLDSYYRDLSDFTLEQRAHFNFDEPGALDHDLFLQQLISLSASRAVEKPVYDFTTHARTGATEMVQPAEFIIVEGLFVLWWPDVRALQDTRVYVDLDDKSCLDRRIRRDVAERGRTPESVLLQYAETVRPMAREYVLPSREFAHVVIPGDMPEEPAIRLVLAHVARQRVLRGVSRGQQSSGA